jgi:hypothetical protein
MADFATVDFTLAKSDKPYDDLAQQIVLASNDPITDAVEQCRRYYAVIRERRHWLARLSAAGCQQLPSESLATVQNCPPPGIRVRPRRQFRCNKLLCLFCHARRIVRARQVLADAIPDMEGLRIAMYNDNDDAHNDEYYAITNGVRPIAENIHSVLHDQAALQRGYRERCLMTPRTFKHYGAQRDHIMAGYTWFGIFPRLDADGNGRWVAFHKGLALVTPRYQTNEPDVFVVPATHENLSKAMGGVFQVPAIWQYPEDMHLPALAALFDAMFGTHCLARIGRRPNVKRHPYC